VVEIPNHDYEGQLCVQCFLCPQQDSVLAILTMSPPWNQWIEIGSEQFWITDADMWISSVSQGEKRMIKTSGNKPIYGFSQKEFAILPGETYRLSILTEDSLWITAETTVPRVKIIWNHFDTLYRFDQETEGRVGTYMAIEGSWMVGDESIDAVAINNITITDNATNWVLYSQAIVRNATLDKTIGLQKFRKNIQINPTIGYEQVLSGLLITPSPEYGNYLRCMELNDLNLSNTEEWNKAFQSDNLPFGFSNIIGGIGIFGSYQYAVIQIPINSGL